MNDKKRSTEVVSDNSLNDAKLVDILGAIQSTLAQLTNQGATTQSTIDTLAKNFVTSSRTDEDVSETEVIRSQNLAWPFNQKMIAAVEWGKLMDGFILGHQINANLVNQQNLINTNAITQSNNANNSLVTTVSDLQKQIARYSESLGVTLQKEIDTLIVQPYPYAENAPATQDTGGEGDDTGDTGAEDE